MQAGLFILLNAIALLPTGVFLAMRGKAMRHGGTGRGQLAAYVSTLVLQHAQVDGGVA